MAFNVAPVDGRERGYDLGGVALLILNEVEAAALAGVPEPDPALDALCRRYPSCDVVITLGRDGVRHGRGDARLRLEAFPADAVDETAAGDAFVGYLMAALLEGKPMREALVLGSAAGALAVTQAGAASSIPGREAVRLRAGAR